MPWTPLSVQTGIKIWSFVQSSPAQTWNINHEMGSEPTIEISVYVNDVLVKAFPQSIVYTDANNIVVEWSKPFAGNAVLTAS